MIVGNRLAEAVGVKDGVRVIVGVMLGNEPVQALGMTSGTLYTEASRLQGLACNANVARQE